MERLYGLEKLTVSEALYISVKNDKLSTLISPTKWRKIKCGDNFLSNLIFATLMIDQDIY